MPPLKTGIKHPPIVEKILRESVCDFCIIGECDVIIDQILEGKEFQGTARLQDDTYSEEQERLMKNLDSLPIPRAEAFSQP